MVTLFVPEDVWAPRSWGINHPLYVRQQIAHGLEEVGHGYWGFSPAASPRGGYEVYGVKALGTYSLGYFSYEITEAVGPQGLHAVDLVSASRQRRVRNPAEPTSSKPWHLGPDIDAGV